MSKAANGSGTVYKPKHPSKNFPFRAEVWITDLSRPSGKRRISKNFKKRTDAERWRDEQLAKYGSSVTPYICDPNITLADWLAFWLDTFALNIKDSTRTGYECYIRQHIAKHPIGNIKLKELTNCHLQTYIHYLSTAGNLKDGSAMNPKTIRSMLLMIRKSLHAAIGADLLQKNPAEFVELPKLEQNEIEHLTIDQIRRLIEVSKHERWGIFFPLAFFTGCRIGELGALRQSSLRQEGDIWYIAVEGSLNRVKDFTGESGKKTVLRIGSTKNGKSRQIPIPEELVTALQCHFAQQRAEADLFGTYMRDPYIFCNELGDSFVDPGSLRNWAKDMAENAGISHFYPHLLRKSFATIAAESMDVKNVSAILGHQSCNVSANYYIASDLRTKSEAVAKMHPISTELFRITS